MLHRAPPSALRRLLPWLLAVAPLACAPEETAPPDDRVSLKLTFDEVTYIEGASAPRKVVERVKNQTRSIFPALRKADVMVLSNQQVDIELAQLKREPITVVDPATGSTKQAVREHFRYVTLAQVPKALAERGKIELGVLHTRDGAQAERVLVECSANGDRERQAVTELWTVFDASLPGCADAMAREQAAIDVARRKLAHPDREVVPAEIARVYLPVTVHLVRRQSPKPAQPAPGAGDPGGDQVVHERAPHAPGSPPTPAEPAADDVPAVVYVDKEREKLSEEGEDERELRRQARAMGGDLDTPAPPPVYTFSSGHYLAPNYAVLYLAIIAFVVLLVGQQRRRSKR